MYVMMTRSRMSHQLIHVLCMAGCNLMPNFPCPKIYPVYLGQDATLFIPADVSRDMCNETRHVRDQVVWQIYLYNCLN